MLKPTLVFLVIAFFHVQCLAASSVNVPLDSWAYPALEKLEAYGLVESAMPGTRPYSRLEAARLIAEASRKWSKAAVSKTRSGFAEKELIPALLKRLKDEFRNELVELGEIQGVKRTTFLKPVDEVIMKYIHQTDNPVVHPQGGMPPTHIVYPIYNNDGIVYRKHNNFSMEVEGEGKLWNHFSLYYRPIVKNFEGEGVQLDLEKGYLKAEALNIELEVGRDSLWWGAGRHGALLMTNNARPFDLVKISNSQPFLLPLLGLLKFDLFLSRLDYENPYIPKPLLYGLRLDFKPHPIFEIGFSQVAIFGGEGRTDLSPTDYLKILYSNRNLTRKLESNQQVSVDFSLRWPDFDKLLPLARSLKFYGEVGAEDTGFPPDRRAFLLGLFFSDLFLTGRVDLRLEYANTSPESVPTAWYTHSMYPLIYHERLFGHHVGSNGQDIFARLTCYLSPNVLLGIDFDAETQGQKEAVKTESYQWGIDLDYLFLKNVGIKGRYLVEKFKDSDSIAGGDATHHFFGLELRWGL